MAVDPIMTLSSTGTTLLALVMLLLIGCDPSEQTPSRTTDNSAKRRQHHAQRILFIDSYHRGYAWSDGITEGIVAAFDGQLQDDDQVTTDPDSAWEIFIHRMDTKRHNAPADLTAAASLCLQVIDERQPDLIIAADDNASALIVEPHLKNAQIPVVFCGVNWDASRYGYPYRNATGMVEVNLIDQALAYIRPHAKGGRIALIHADTVSEARNVEAAHTVLGLDFAAYPVSTAKELHSTWLRLQDECDILVLFEILSVEGFDRDAFIALILQNSKVPSCSAEFFLAPFVCLSVGKEAIEQGRWSADCAKRILAGTNPAEIPIVRNHQAGIVINMPLTKKLGITFPFELIDQARLIDRNDLDQQP